MKTITNLWLILLVSVSFGACSSEKKSIEPAQVYMFTSFHEPATEGLRLLYSYDGYKWDSIPGIFLKPEVGTQKIMRDPSIARGKDGTYHLVWTCSWKGDFGFGYSSSKDLKNWSKQEFIPVSKAITGINSCLLQFLRSFEEEYPKPKSPFQLHVQTK